MTPNDAVQQLAGILADTIPPFSEDDVYDSLERSGIPDDVADRAYKFAQLACGRMFLDGMGVSFSNDYLCFNANGDAIETGQVDQEPHYIAATQLAGPNKIGGPSFNHFALMPADVHAINDLLNKGSNPADLVTAPAFLFLEAPNELGMANAQRIISQHMAKLQADQPLPKPWWKFW